MTAPKGRAAPTGRTPADRPPWAVRSAWRATFAAASLRHVIDVVASRDGFDTDQLDAPRLRWDGALVLFRVDPDQWDTWRQLGMASTRDADGRPIGWYVDDESLRWVLVPDPGPHAAAVWPFTTDTDPPAGAHTHDCGCPVVAP